MNRRLKLWACVIGLCGAWSAPAGAQVSAAPDSLQRDTVPQAASETPVPPVTDTLPVPPAVSDSARGDSLPHVPSAPADSLATDSARIAPVTDSLSLDTLPAATQVQPDSTAVDTLPPALEIPEQAGPPPPPPGTTGGDRMGTCAVTLQDVDRDGRPDVAVGVPGADSGAVNSGAVMILSGVRGDTLTVLRGEGPGDALGASLALIGDVNRDGVPELACGAPYRDADSTRVDVGKVYVHSGASRDVLWSLAGERSQALFGSVLAGLGDTDGDGTPDLAVGLSPTPGDSLSGPGASVWIVSGTDGRVLHKLSGEQHADRYGTALCTAGDVDGDGSDDLLVGASRYSDGARLSAGAVYVVSGRSGNTLHKIVGRAMFEQFGYSVAGGRDLNGDGTPDLAVGARFLDHEGGRRGGVYLFSGKDGAQLGLLPGLKPGQQFGTSLAFASDLDLDGRADLLVGAPGMTRGESSEGVYRIASGSGTVISTALGTQSGSRFGSAIAELGDVDGDGRPELVAGAPYHSKGGLFAGAVQVVSGGTGEAVWSCFGVSSLRQGDSERVAPLMSLEQLKQEVGGYGFPVFDSSEVDASPIIRRSSAAVYPATALGTGAMGWVKVRVLVMPDGTAAESKVIDLAGLSPEFGEAALEAVRDWSFLPASREGVEVACWAIFPIGFSPPLSPEEQRRVDSIAALDSTSSLVVDAAAATVPATGTDSAAAGIMYYEVDQVDVAPVLTARVEPDYPPPALITREECTVHIKVLVNGQGAVAEVQVGDVTVMGKGFESAAVTAVGKWRYEPGVKDGNKVAVWVPEEVRFSPPSNTE